MATQQVTSRFISRGSQPTKSPRSFPFAETVEEICGYIDDHVDKQPQPDEFSRNCQAKAKAIQERVVSAKSAPSKESLQRMVDALDGMVEDLEKWNSFSSRKKRISVSLRSMSSLKGKYRSAFKGYTEELDGLVQLFKTNPNYSSQVFICIAGILSPPPSPSLSRALSSSVSLLLLTFPGAPPGGRGGKIQGHKKREEDCFGWGGCGWSSPRGRLDRTR